MSESVRFPGLRNIVAFGMVTVALAGCSDKVGSSEPSTPAATQHELEENQDVIATTNNSAIAVGLRLNSKGIIYPNRAHFNTTVEGMDYMKIGYGCKDDEVNITKVKYLGRDNEDDTSIDEGNKNTCHNGYFTPEAIKDLKNYNPQFTGTSNTG